MAISVTPIPANASLVGLPSILSGSVTAAGSTSSTVSMPANGSALVNFASSGVASAHFHVEQTSPVVGGGWVYLEAILIGQSQKPVARFYAANEAPASIRVTASAQFGIPTVAVNAQVV